ncbi:MAG: hypothetical protein Q9216_007125, partial [Gyalolechia sp. 2 TL-2023]
IRERRHCRPSLPINGDFYIQQSAMPALYDTFLIQEPLRQDPFAVTHNPSDRATLVEVYSKSIEFFEERSRRRAVERLRYEVGVLYMQGGEWRKALRILEPLWRNVSWRKEGWWALLGGLGERTSNVTRLLRTDAINGWAGFGKSLKEDYDFSKCLQDMGDLGSKPRVVIRADELVSFTLGFGTTQGNVGEPLPAQMIVASHAQRSTIPITFSHILVSFEGGLKDIRFQHEAGTESSHSTSDGFCLCDISLHTDPDISSSLKTASSDYLSGTSELTIDPGETKILSFDLVPRESSTVRVACITSLVETESFDLEYVVSGADYVRQEDFWFETTEGIGRRPAGSNGADGIRIQPKPPKVQINVPQLQKDYLIDETVRLELEIKNEEDDDAEVTLEARFLGQADTVPTWVWITDQKDIVSPEGPLDDSEEESTPSYNLGRIERSGSRQLNARFTARSIPTEAVLEIKAIYNVLSEPDTPISKVLVHEVVFDRPFEANYDFQPCIDHRALPNYFTIIENHNPNHSAHGLRQLWTTTARLASFAPEPLIINEMTLEVSGVHDGAICRVEYSSSSDQRQQAVLAPNDFHEGRFDISAQKIDIDDRLSTVIEFQLKVRWQRNQPDASPTTTVLTVPDLIIPFGEPRVLATTNSSQAEGLDFHPLDYTIENPSTHVLNFDVSMETNDDFAFSGPKTTSVQLVPVSRHVVRYRIVPLVRGKWITPNLRVLDTHFNQVLKVQGTAGMRNDKRGASIWIDAED